MSSGNNNQARYQGTEAPEEIGITLKYHCFFGVLLFCLILIPFILVICFSICFYRQYKNGYFNDLYENWKKKPIMEISIEETDQNEKLIIGKSLDDNNLYKWKGIEFKVKRGKSDYFDSFTKNKNSKLCGIDSNGNYLYFDECPINYIEISENNQPFLSKYGYQFKTIQINSNTFIHYSNDFIYGEILVDLHISDYLGPCSNKNKNDVCPYFSNCKNKCSFNDTILDNSFIKLNKLSFLV